MLVLHTDGVIEAARDGAMFDVHGMRRALATARGETAREILDELLSALDGYASHDDATPLVVRQIANAGAAHHAALVRVAAVCG